MMVAFVVLYIYALKFEYFPPHYLVRSIYLSNFFFFFLKITNSLLVMSRCVNIRWVQGVNIYDKLKLNLPRATFFFFNEKPIATL